MAEQTLEKIALYSFFASASVLAGAILLEWLSAAGGLRTVQPAVAAAGARISSERRDRTVPLLATAGAWTLTLALASLTISLVARTVAARRPPYASQYEFAIAFAWGILLVYVVLIRGRHARGLGLTTLALALGLLLYASTLPSALLPPVPALQNPLLLGLHVGSAIAAYGANAVAFGAATLFLVQAAARSRTGRYLSILPSVRVLDELAYRAVMVGFPMLAATLLLGSWWASIAWGYYWNWDPKECAALATWLTYGAYLHVRVQREQQCKACAVLLVLGFAATLFTFAGNLFFDSLHSYAGI